MAGSKGTRMAGEKDNAAIRDAIAKSPERTAKRLEGVGFDRDAYDFSGFSDADIVRSLQGGSYGDEDYARLTGKPVGGSDPKPAADPEPAADPKPTIDVTGDVTGPVITKPEPKVRPIDGHDLSPTKPVKPPKRGGGYGNNTNEQTINKTIDFGDFYGGTVGHITGNSGTVTVNQQDQSTNTAGGDTQYNWQSGDYRPSFMRYF